MDIVARTSGGQNIVARPQARPPWYVEATVDAVEVEVFFQEIDPATGALIGVPRPLGRFPLPGQIVFTDYIDTDRDLRLYFVPYAADGTPAVSELAHAQQVTVLRRRETDAPVIGLTKEATEESAEIGIAGFTRFARRRRVTVSANADMSDPIVEIVLDSEAYESRALPLYLILSRYLSTTLSTEGGLALTTEAGETLVTEDEESELPPTVYVTVAHSGGNGWTPESNVLEVTFAGSSTPGTSGDFDPVGKDFYRFDMGEV